MSINDATGQIQHNVHDTFSDVTTSSYDISEQVGSIFDMNPWEVGGSFGAEFAGMASDKIPTFNAAVDTYRNAIQDIINGLENKRVWIESAVKGQVADSVESFFRSVKDLLNAYVKAIDTEKKLVQEANENWLAAAGKIAGNVSDDASVIRSSASSIKVD